MANFILHPLLPAMGYYTLPDTFTVGTLHGWHIAFAELRVSVVCDVLCTMLCKQHQQGVKTEFEPLLYVCRRS